MSGFEPLVGFKNNFDDNDLYYFDLSSDTWVKCKPIGRLPYNLCKYQIENSIIGFVGNKIKRKFDNSMVFGHETYGDGNVIYFVDNIMFRSFWENGKLFLANSIFFN